MPRAQFSLNKMLWLMTLAAVMLGGVPYLAPLVGLSSGEALIVAAVAILLFGSNLPWLARGITSRWRRKNG